jgi:hypothetical protein
VDDTQGFQPVTGPHPAGRVYLAIAILAVVALGNLQLPIRTFMMLAREGGRDDSAELLEHFQQLDSHLPPAGRIGYLSARNGDRPRILEGGRLAIAQYALAPRIVDCFCDQPVVILDGDDPAELPELQQAQGWRLTADLPGGLKLYRTREEE